MTGSTCYFFNLLNPVYEPKISIGLKVPEVIIIDRGFNFSKELNANWGAKHLICTYPL